MRIHLLARAKNLNPLKRVEIEWSRSFAPEHLRIESLANFISCLLLFLSISKRPWSFRQVFDYDWGLQDDFMGEAQLDLTQIELGQAQDIALELKDHARPKQHLGEIYLSVTLWPRNQQEKEQVFQLLPRI